GLPSGSPITSGFFNFTISYTGGSGANDVVLTLTNVPGSATRVDTTTGNGNHVVDPNECNSLDLVISNKSGATMSGVTATLSCSNLAVAITQPYSDYPNVPASGSRTNVTPF